VNPLSNSATALSDFFAHPFLVHALVAGSAVALAAGLAGYFLVLRGQVFTGDVLGHVAFTGAAAALAFGIDARIGLLVATIGAGIAMGLLGEKGRADDVVIGNVLAWVLGVGVFLLTLYVSSRSAGTGVSGVSVLFGSIFGLNASQAWSAAAISAAVIAVLLFIARPLLFASVDTTVAAARGVPVRLLGVLFLALVGAAAAAATQAVGALLLLGLLAAPAGAAHRLTARPYLGLFAAGAIALFDMWAGIALSYLLPVLPPSFAIIAVASAIYAAAFLVTAWRGGSRADGPRKRRRLVGASAALMVLVVLGALVVLPVAGCAPKAKQSVVGEWRAADTYGKAGSLSDLSLLADGHFYYGGKNALGGPVRFGGRYQTGEQDGAAWIRLDFDAYPNRPTVWFYRVDGDKLTVSSARGNLTNGSALVFTKR
jgi:zinc/manganese transport system permease protein